MSNNDIDEIKKNEKDWMDAWCLNDRKTCERILSDDFILSSARGVLIDKPNWLKSLDFIIGEEFKWEEINVRLYDNTAVVNARTRQKATVNDKDWSGLFLLTDVWVKQNDNWQVVSRHGTGPITFKKK